MVRRILATLLAALAAASILALSGCGSLGGADKYPTKQITYISPFDPGGLNDREARRQQPYLEKTLGQKIVIDYKVGGGGAIAWAEMVRGKPDGYTITGINIPHIILQPLQQEVGYKTEQIQPIALFQGTPLVLAVLKTSRFTTLKELLDEAKKNPGKVTLGGVGSFSGHHVATLRLEKLTGTKFEYASFSGGAPQITAFLGGHVDAIVANSGDILRYLDQTRLLASATKERFSAYPDAPTFKEQGVDLEEGIERGVGVPAGTPESVVKKLESAFLDIAKKVEVLEAHKKEGILSLARGSQESKALIEKLTGIYKELTAGLKK